MPEKKHDRFPEGRKPKGSDPHHPHGGAHIDRSHGQHGQGGRNPDPGHQAHSHTGEDAARGGHIPGAKKPKPGPGKQKDDDSHHGQPGAATPGAITGRLKSETQDLHSAAEGHELQRALFKGRLPREQYVEHLGQLFLIHRALESHIRRLRPSTPALKAVVKDHQFQEPYLREDLAHFGVDADSIEPLPATLDFLGEIDRAAAKSPLSLLGFHYVLEGSNNGSKFIAVNVRKAYGLTPGKGDRYLDPYGDQQREHWQAFKRDMDAMVFTEPQAAELISAARAMFSAISAIGDDLLARHPVA